jgi:hypothetical protein
MEQARLLIINGESEWMWKAAVVTSFKVPTQYSHGVTEKNYAPRQDIRSPVRTRPGPCSEFGRCSIKILAHTLASLNEAIHGLPKSFQANAWVHL